MLLGSTQNPAGLQNSLSALVNDPARLQGRQNVMTGMAADQARKDTANDFSSHMGQFDSFLGDPMVQRLIGPTGSTNQSSSISGPGLGAGTWRPTFGAAGMSGSGGAPMPTLPSPQSTAGIQFARAKDTVANSLTGLMKAVRDNYAGRNLSGGTGEMNAVGNILLGGQKQLADTARAGALADANTANDFAKTGYEGALTGRGQDISANNALNALELQARGQDLEQSRFAQSQAQSQSQNGIAALMGLMNAFKSLY